MTAVKRMLQIFMLSMLLVNISCQNSTGETAIPWNPLFNEIDLAGWNQKGGAAIYSIRDKMIVGSTVHNTPNSFLTTNRIYGDFILELDYKVDSSMNSGIQIRSNSFPYYNNGRVHGYQIEIDPSERAWSGGIFDESRRGWLNPLNDNPKAQAAFKQNDWNHYRIEAIGDTIKTWINEVPAAYLIDDKTHEGFIALQVHGIPASKKEGTEIWWKNIRILTDSLYKYSTVSPLQPITTKNTLSQVEIDGGWKLLFDGKATSQWRSAKSDSFPLKGWQVQDGELTVLASGGAESAAGGDIVTKEKYTDFDLQLDFKLTEGANSGIKYYVDTELNKAEGSAIGLEYQLLDDAIHPDAKLGNHKGSRTLASLYDLIQAAPTKPFNGVEQWNTARIVSTNQQVTHWLNDVKVLEYERGSAEFKKLVAESKYKDWPSFGLLNQGHILLQDHGDKVSFRNIKIKPL